MCYHILENVMVQASVTIFWNNLMKQAYGYICLFKLMENAMVPGDELSISGTADLSRPMRAKRAKV